jgi:lysophospholipase L1-like esterase
MKRVVFAAVAVLLLLGLGEALARLSPPPDGRTGTWGGAAAAGAAGDVLLDGSPWLLWELRPGDHVEKGVHVHVNALGLRDRDRGPRERPRALAVGDSSVYGFGVEDDEVFTARLEAALPADVVNAAVPGYSTWQSLNLLDMRALALDPDLLIVANLWSDNNFDSFVDVDLLASYAGWEASPLHRVREALSASVLFRRLDWTLRVAPQGARARKVGWQVGDADPKIGRRRVAINDYAANLDAMASRMYERGGGALFVVLANREDLRGDAADPAWEPYRRVMRETAERWGAPVVELPPIFRASGHSADALFLDQMHPTPLGHQILADAIRAQLGGWPATPLRLHPPTPRPVYMDRFDR